jgi:fluoroquinolone transport system ATP-binding protein
MIEVKDLYFKYSEKDAFCIDHISFNIDKGEIFGFLGPNGAGKTTVQEILTGLLKQQGGTVLYQGKSIEEQKEDFYNKIGVSFEFPNLYGKLTGYENLKYFAGLFSVPTVDPNFLLDLVGIKDAANKRTEQYSKGMKQRAVFARSLINNPEILFLDEPVSGLDPTTAKSIKQVIRKEKEKGTTIFLTTHNMFVAEELCDEVAFIDEGKIITIDTPKNLKLQYGNKSVEVEYKMNEHLQKEMLFLENKDDKSKLQNIIAKNQIITMHTKEATLEEIFIKLTGRGLV